MKKLIFAFVLGLAVPCFFAFKPALPHLPYDTKNSTAEVEQVQGVYIFTDARPVKEYTYLGSVTAGIGAMQYTSIKTNLAKKAKKQFPNADGVLLHFNSMGFDKADVIQFK